MDTRNATFLINFSCYFGGGGGGGGGVAGMGVDLGQALSAASFHFSTPTYS